jgi:hypothetical protein
VLAPDDAHARHRENEMGEHGPATSGERRHDYADSVAQLRP